MHQKHLLLKFTASATGARAWKAITCSYETLPRIIKSGQPLRSAPLPAPASAFKVVLHSPGPAAERVWQRALFVTLPIFVSPLCKGPESLSEDRMSPPGPALLRVSEVSKKANAGCADFYFISLARVALEQRQGKRTF